MASQSQSQTTLCYTDYEQHFTIVIYAYIKEYNVYCCPTLYIVLALLRGGPNTHVGVHSGTRPRRHEHRLSATPCTRDRPSVQVWLSSYVFDLNNGVWLERRTGARDHGMTYSPKSCRHGPGSRRARRRHARADSRYRRRRSSSAGGPSARLIAGAAACHCYLRSSIGGARSPCRARSGDVLV